ncbi:MAG: oxygen-insensitive NADPH nitroreductase [Gammaproteobacteria bacterium]|nr:oxygen-insensitive NADPH nitroreductase [Gammaproteobacteria bacterium]
MNAIIELLREHRSVRRFKPEPITSDILETIIQAGSAASTSNFLQAYSVILVTDENTRKKVAELAGPQIWVERCPVFLVFCADLKRTEIACEIEGRKMESGYTEQFMVATVDTALMAQNVMIAAESLGLGGVFIGGIRNDPDTVCELLELPEHVYPVFGMCLGYPDEQPEKKPRLPVEVILNRERYQTDNSDVLGRYNETCLNYYQQRSSQSRKDTWTQLVSMMMSKAYRTHMKDFLQKKGFLLK